MKLAFSTIISPEKSFKEILGMAKDMKYNGIEMRGMKNEAFVPAISNFSAGRISETKERLSALNIDISCLSSSCLLYDKNSVDRTFVQCKEYIDLASALSVPYVRVLGDKYVKPQFEIDDDFVASFLTLLTQYGKNQGVSLLIETNGAYACSERLKKLLDKVNAPNLFVLWDIHHTYRYFNESPEKTISVLGDKIKYVHAKDSKISPSGKVIYTMFGEGDIPLAEAVTLLKDKGFDGYISLEVGKDWYIDTEEPGVLIMQYVSFMKKLI